MTKNKKKILFFLSRIPFPLEKGDKLRAYHQIKHLSKYYSISLCILSDKEIDPTASKELKQFVDEIYIYKTTRTSIFLNLITAGIKGYPFQVGYFFNSGAHYYFKNIIEQIQPDHLFVQLIRMTEYVKHISNIPKSLDYMDTFSKGMERRGERTNNPIKKWIFNLEKKRLLKYEQLVFQDFQKTYIISEQDKEAFGFENASMEVLPNGLDQSFFEPQHIDKKYDLLFTGNMSYAPNVDAVQFVVKKILPLLWEKYPDITFYIAGAEPASSVKALASDKVFVSGWLDDIRDAYASSKIFIAPLQLGTGLQNKLLEAMSMELPCVTSSLANNALGAQNSTQILLGNSVEEYVSHIQFLIENPEQAQSIASEGRKHVANEFDWEALAKKMQQSIG